MQLGKSTYVISLPTKWVKTGGLNKGDELEVTICGSSINVSYEGSGAVVEEVLEIDISNLSNEMAIRFLLPPLHKNGYNKIVLNCRLEQIPLIQEKINSMLFGYEIISVVGNKCTVKMISQESKEDFDNLLRRVFLVTLQLAENTYLLIKDKKYDKLQDLIVLEKTNNKLTNYVERLINKQMGPEKKNSFLYVVTWVQENIGDEYKYICQVLAKEKNLDESFVSVFEEMNKLLRMLYNLFYTFSFEAVEEICQKKKELGEEISKLLEVERSVNQTKIVFYLFTLVRHVDDSIGSVIAYHH